MNTANNNDRRRCSVITLLKKGYDVLKRFVIRKSIQLNDNSITSISSDSDIPAIIDDSDLSSDIDPQVDFLFDIPPRRTNFSSQFLSDIGNQENNNELIEISDTERGLIS
ncbi:unnamed protein product [Acanthocheilonema viteae]|uniref:Uncharacterized protein n=1 Tax=Acanthocheilonema viteae TaxID=6277 RepID=A0A498SMF0_ACAVI|nr:unnamed protein product [Acanthocheilonema viteae]